MGNSKMTQIEDDPNERWPIWKTTQMKTIQMEDEISKGKDNV